MMEIEHTTPQQNTLAFVSLGMGIAAVVFSIMSLCCCVGWILQFLLSVAAFATGGVAIMKAKASAGEMGGEKVAYAGIGLGVVSWVIGCGWIVLGVALNPELLGP